MERFDVADIIYTSRYVILMPGDVIFTGTPQTTRALAPGEIVEIEVQHVCYFGLRRKSLREMQTETSAKQGSSIFSQRVPASSVTRCENDGFPAAL